ncbi:MAG: hypothetical protein ACOYJQ_16935 [Pseudochelatococcus sp.]|uniref:hypothetical protein n=1 Tax=Pseudochelatococcus sp. TaxID=2020869 RepID=UPI003D8AD5EA
MNAAPLFHGSADLGPDAGEMLAGLRRWVECESPSIDPRAVNRMMVLASSDLAVAAVAVLARRARSGGFSAGGRTRRRPVRQGPPAGG